MSKLQLGGTSPEYGDRTLLDKFRQSTRPLPVSGAPAPKRGPGRPAGQPAPAPAAGPTPGGGALPPEHVGLMDRLYRAEDVAQYWVAIAQQAPTPFAKMQARRAVAVRDQIALRLYKSTPNFE